MASKLLVSDGLEATSDGLQAASNGLQLVESPSRGSLGNSVL